MYSFCILSVEHQFKVRCHDMLLHRMDITMVKKYVAKQYHAYIDDTLAVL